MTEITNYRCDICGAIYSSEADAEQCEDFHIVPTSQIGVVFKPMRQTTIPYPAYLSIKMNDDNVVEYIYHSLVGKSEDTETVPAEQTEPAEPSEPGEPEEPEEPIEPEEPEVLDEGEPE